MKSHLDTLLDIYEGVFHDAAIRWPDSTGSFGKDLSYLRRAAKERGIGFFTLTLPELGKVIDRSLSESVFLTSLVPNGIPKIKKRLELFQDLYKKIFDDSGTLREDEDIEAIFFIRQLCYLCKKMRLECPTPKVKDTLNEFFAIEANLPRPRDNTWLSDEPIWKPVYGHPLSRGDARGGGSRNETLLFPDDDHSGLSFPWTGLRACARRYVSELGIPDWWELVPKHGKGAISDREKGVVKYDFIHWPRKLGLWFPYDWYGSGNLHSESHPSDREPPSRLHAVPKTYKGPRLIAAEPAAHIWVQLSIWNWLKRRVPQTLFGRSVRFTDQEWSRKRTLSSSMDGKYCTIDLSSASDRMSCRLVEYLFQGSEILEGIHACRTRLMAQTISASHPNVIALNKFATQGSALTFPLQSMVYTMLVVWALRLHEGKGMTLEGLEADAKRVTVFGDDIIAPSSAYETIKLVLHECGLKVNDSKSFAIGKFRESCGMDAYNGVDVTPAYHLDSYDGSATSTASIIAVSNNFFERGLWMTASKILAQLPPQEAKLLPVIRSGQPGTCLETAGEDGGLGLSSFCGSDYSHLRQVWNKDLQRTEYLALTFTSKVKRTKGTGQAHLTQYFTETHRLATGETPDQDGLTHLDEFRFKSGEVGPVTIRKTVTGVRA
jgi:hypothetical protein